MTQERQFQVGDKVILGEHQADPNGKFGKDWNPDMNQYVGTVATITVVNVVSWSNSGSWYKVDTNIWAWRGVNMTLVNQAAASASTAHGAKCRKCQEFNEYVPASDSFVCYGCSH